MIIFHPWVPGIRTDDQAKCWEALAPLRKRYHVIDAEIHPASEHGYWFQLGKVWAQESLEALLIVEHDVAPSLELVLELETCPLDICTRPPGGAPAGAPLNAWLGCTRFSWRAQQRVPWAFHAALEPISWRLLDRDLTTTVARAAGQYWHVHGEPLEHYHNHV